MDGNSIATSAEERGRALDQLRIRLGMSQEEIAPMLGVRQSAVSRWIRAKVDFAENPLALQKAAEMAKAAGLEELAAQLGYDELFEVPHASHPAMIKVGRVVDAELREWLALIEEVADLALAGRSAPPEIAAIIAYWREAPPEVRAGWLSQAATAKLQQKRRAQRKGA